MNSDEMKGRTQDFAFAVIRLVRILPRTDEGRVIARQLLRAGTSVGANYRAACRARSRPEFIAKLGIVLEEADETVYWLELIRRAGLLPDAKINSVLREANELVSIFVASLRTAKL